MNITTSRGNTYSYICQTGEIIAGFDSAQSTSWDFVPLSPFSVMPELNMFIIGITERCNLRCTYCCYSGQYKNNRSHSPQGMTNEDIDKIFDFIQKSTLQKPINVSFYGGEPLLKFPLIQYAADKGRHIYGEYINFSITTNATLLSPEKIDWLIENDFDINISLDGTQTVHDKYRVYPNGKGSFDDVYQALKYIKKNHSFQQYMISIQLTLASYNDIEEIAEWWHSDPILSDYEPGNIHGLAPNFSMGVEKVDYEKVKSLYSHLLDVYEQHPEWSVLKVLFDECIAYWKTRPIMDIDRPIPMSTCMPINTKLYIDANKNIGVCEKIADKYRIGSIHTGIDWQKANVIVQDYYNKRIYRCKNCPIIGMCNLCLTAVEYTDEQWDVLCHNEQIYAQVFMYIFCEMAERGMIR